MESGGKTNKGKEGKKGVGTRKERGGKKELRKGRRRRG